MTLDGTFRREFKREGSGFNDVIGIHRDRMVGMKRIWPVERKKTKMYDMKNNIILVDLDGSRDSTKMPPMPPLPKPPAGGSTLPPIGGPSSSRPEMSTAPASPEPDAMVLLIHGDGEVLEQPRADVAGIIIQHRP